MKKLIALTFTAVCAYAGPPLVCHQFPTAPGSLFTRMEPLRQIAIEADDSPQKQRLALEKLAQFRAAVKPDDANSLIDAGYLTEALRQVGRTKESDGPSLLEKALALRPDDSELLVLTGLAHSLTNKEAFLRHFNRARTLAKPGSPAAKLIKEVDPLTGYSLK